MYGFTERWWRNPAVKLPAASNGSVFTDLPLQCTWETSRGQTGESGILTNFLGGSAAKNFTTERFDKFKEELNRVFPGIGDKFDGKRAMMNWPEYKFTRGSYTCPLVGQYTTLARGRSAGGAGRPARFRRRTYERRFLRLHERRGSIRQSRGQRNHRAEEKRIAQGRLIWRQSFDGGKTGCQPASCRNASAISLSARTGGSRGMRKDAARTKAPKRSVSP